MSFKNDVLEDASVEKYQFRLRTSSIKKEPISIRFIIWSGIGSLNSILGESIYRTGATGNKMKCDCWLLQMYGIKEISSVSHK